MSKAVGRGVYFMSNVKERTHIFFDKNWPSIIVEIDGYINGYTGIRNRGEKLERSNLSYLSNTD